MAGAGKRKRETLEDLLARPWCYYCNRDFNDDAVLQDHQRTQHFLCHAGDCQRKLNTASGLGVHMQQVHKLPLNAVRNAIEGRENPAVEVFGVVGIPDELLKAHREAIISEWYKRAAEYKARTGNPLPGTVTQDPNKKGKLDETKEEKKARMLQHIANNRAKKAAAAAAEAGATTQTTAINSNAGIVPSTSADPVQVDVRELANGHGTLHSPNGIYNGMHQPVATNTVFQQPFATPDGLPINRYGRNMTAYAPTQVNSGYYGMPMQGVQPSYAPTYGLPTSPFNMQAPFPLPTHYQATSPPASANLPTPPGLPQRPTTVPNPSRTEMERMHALGTSGGYGPPTNASTTTSFTPPQQVITASPVPKKFFHEEPCAALPGDKCYRLVFSGEEGIHRVYGASYEEVKAAAREAARSRR